ncbi:MAG: hypothetical protein V1833_00480 [Elusimicrobiota bacterium]
MKKDRYVLTLNKNQLYVLQSALEVLSRMHSGQWDMAFDEVFRFRYKDHYKKMDADWTGELQQFLERKSYKGTFYEVLDFFKYRILGLEPNAGFGVGIGRKNVSDDLTTSFDIKQVIRTMLEDEREPCQFDTKNSLPTINIKPREKTNTLRLTRQRYKK